MSVSLFRRWRSQKFSDLVGQESVVSTLQNVLGAGDPARAYLFCGPRGTGKTSSARIFAKALNCENGPAAEPCNECSQCRSISDGSNLDVFEIDAASHTQVDKIRDFIVEKVHFTPVSARYKVYIIDEVHKLSTSSFNALLKTLEEPPSHVVFVLATTHPHEMPPTILSRCQRYDFRPLTATEAENHLKMIAQKENISLEEDAARQLARAADGSLRDALVLFEQAHVFSDGEVTRDKVLDLLGGVGYEVLEEMFTDLHQGDAASALKRLDGLIVHGRDLKRLAEAFQDHLRMMLLLKVKSEDQSIRHLSTEERTSLDRVTKLLSVGAITQWLRAVGEMLGQIRHGQRARLLWEMFLVSLAHPESDPELAGLERRVERLEQSGGTGGAPVSSGDTGGALMERILPRLEALENQETSRVEAEVAQLKKALSDVQKALMERPVAPAESKPVSAAPEAEVPAEAPQSEPVVPPETAKPEPIAEAPATTSSPVPSKQETRSEGPPERDQVDDWFTMPPVLVTGKIAQSGQIDLLGGDSALNIPEPAAPAPEPVKEPPPQPEPEKSESSQPSPTPEPPEIPQEPPVEESTPPPQEPEPEPTAPQASDPEPKPVASQSPNSEESTPEVRLPDEKEFFRLLMQKVKEQDIRLHAVLADARLAALNPTQFELALPPGYDWHFSKIQEGRALLESVAASVVPGAKLQLECSIGGEKAAPPKESEHEELVKRASGVFGGSSIVE